jgi:hypothetical protein
MLCNMKTLLWGFYRQLLKQTEHNLVLQTLCAVIAIGIARQMLIRTLTVYYSQLLIIVGGLLYCFTYFLHPHA